ncbi:cyanophycinase [Candidatus Rhodobacter oscarellae]|uniref:Cyanophycinase n=2 Tax=Candidatus Rhodobacter oscarellae TaxID=1675527 RepID=A0A0J9EDZ1_9RHOB|nr:cyanophycinase [Candidatus Rhodobacter lobularis]
MLKRAIRQAGGGRSRVLICPFAWRDPKEAADFAKKLFRGLGARSVEVLDIRDHAQAVMQVSNADIIWYSGGLQKRQVLALAGVPGLVRTLQTAYANGTVMVGGSAGAAVMSKLMISGGSSGTAHTRSGLGFLPKVVLDQHVIARSREWRLRQVISKNRRLVGVGLDERTGVLIQNGIFRVYGKSQVIVTEWKQGQLSERRYKRGDKFTV